MKKRAVKILSIWLALTFVCGAFFGCTVTNTDNGGDEIITQKDLMQGISAQVIAERLPDESYYNVLRAVTYAMAQKTLSVDKNSAVSPLASFFDLSLAANGLSNETQNELLMALGEFKIAALNEYNATYAHILKNSTKTVAHTSFRVGLSKSSFSPDSAFLQTNADYYSANGYLFNFAESNISSFIGEWINSKTGIKNITFDPQCNADTASLLVDTISISASFESGFWGKENGKFAAVSGEKEVSYLVAQESLYAKTSKYVGFAKKLDNGLTFTALLPSGTETLETLLQSLDAQTLKACYDGITRNGGFGVKIPEFSFNFAVDTTSAYRSLGIRSVFEKKSVTESEKAEFTVEKMFNVMSVKLNENGFTTSSAGPAAPETSAKAPEAVTMAFDRPFVFIIFDSAGVPLTVGTVVEP